MPHLAGAKPPGKPSPGPQGDTANHGGVIDNGPKYQSAPGTVNGFGQTTESKVVQPATMNAANKDVIDNYYRPTLSAGQEARKINYQLDALERLPVSEKTGWGAQAKAYAANILTSLGIGGDQAKMLASDSQVFNSIMNQQVWSLLGQQKGPQTEGDATRARATFAQLENTPQANQFINDMARALNNRKAQEAQFIQQNYPKALRSNDLTRLQAEWEAKAPSVWDDPAMKKWAGKVSAQTSGQSSSQGFDALPNAASFSGKTIRDTQTGKLMRSNGRQWQEVR